MPKVMAAVEAKAKQTTKPKTVEDGEDPFKKAKRCLDSIGETWYIFDKTVADIYTNQKFQPQYEKFAECAKMEWGMNYVTAMNHVKVGQAIAKFNLTKESLQQFGIGWTNFMEISGTLTPEMTKSQVENRIKKAADMTHDEVVKFKKEIQQGTSDGPPDKFVTLTFKLKNEAADVILNTLKQAKDLAGTEFDDAALEYICLDWQLEHDPKNVKKIKAQMISEPLTAPAEGAAPAKKNYKERADKGKVKSKKSDEAIVELEEPEEEELDELDFEAPKGKVKEVEDEDETEEEEDDDVILGI